MFPWLLYTFVFSLLVCSGKGGKDILKFLKVQTATLSPTTALETVVSTTPEDCATACLSTETCKSFEITRNAPHTCFMYEEDTSERRMSNSTQYDFYQARQSKFPLNIVYGGALAGHDDLDKNIATFTKCVNRCQKEPKCKSVETRSSDNGCNMSSASQLPLYVNPRGWDYVEVNRDILGEVLIRSPSDKHTTNKCNVKTTEGIISFYKKLIQNFLKVDGISLSQNQVLRIVPNTTLEICANTCLSNETCKSFDISTKTPHTCRMYKEDTSVKEITRNNDYDFYQLKARNCPVNIIYGGYINGCNDLEQKTATFAECMKACRKEAKCNSFEYNFITKGINCPMSTCTQLDTQITVHPGSLNYIEINRDLFRKPASNQPISIDCNTEIMTELTSFYKKTVDYSSDMAYFTLEYNPYVNIENMLDTPVRSQVDCSAKCLQDTDCIAFNYYSGTQKTCQLKRLVRNG